MGAYTKLLNEFLTDSKLTKYWLEDKYGIDLLKEALKALLGYSIVHLIKEDDRPISITDLQTDLKYLIKEAKENFDVRWCG